ncbi:MAG: hypothetical protein ABJZ55_17105 [Fuerstiella sp.]
MDLPTCPACGQSVLDDDAADCPFCGAAMDGSSPAKNPAGGAKKKAKPTAETAAAESDASSSKSAADDDPFAIEKPKTARKILPCAPRPMKGRLHKVICPMCDVQGFIPAAAVGRQVKCANKECLVPVFTAGETAQKKTSAPPTRVSDQEDRVASKSSREPGQKNPMVLYGITGTVLLLLAAGGAWYLNKEANQSGQIDPIDMSQFNFNQDDDDDSDDPADSKPPVKEVVPESPNKLAERLVERMVSTARQTGNRDKAFCRSLTANAYMRLGQKSEYDRELTQLTRVDNNGSGKSEYYKIAPLVEQHFRLSAISDAAAAESFLNQAIALKGKMPTIGSQAFDAGIHLAAAMTIAGKTDEAILLVESLQKDQSIVSQIDMIREATWAATSRTLWDFDLNGFSPMTVQQWNEPLLTAVAVCLAARGETKSAIEWTSRISNALTQSDTSAMIADVFRQQGTVAAESQPLVDLARQAGPSTELRVTSLMATSTTDPYWVQAKSGLAKLNADGAMSLPALQQILDMPISDVTNDVMNIQALADFAHSAIRVSDQPSGEKALGLLSGIGLVTVPTAAELRAACFDLSRSEDKVRERLRSELRLNTDSKLRSRFLSYRRAIDRMARLAEERRLQLVFALGRVAEKAGLEVVQSAIDSDAVLKKEVGLDLLKDWVSVCATAQVDQLAVLRTNPADAVPFTRVDPPAELAVMQPLSAFWSQFKKTKSLKEASRLEQGSGLLGFRAATLAYVTRKQFSNPAVSQENLLSLGMIDNKIWRESCLAIASEMMTKAGRFSEVEDNLKAIAVTPTQTILALFGAFRAIELK